MSNDYRIKINNVKYGPFDLKKIKSLLKEGQINKNTLIKKGSDGEWIKIKNLKKFLKENKNKVDTNIPVNNEPIDFPPLPDDKTKETESQIEIELKEPPQNFVQYNKIIVANTEKSPSSKIEIGSGVYDEDEWYLVDNGKADGPYPKRRIEKIIKNPKLTKKAYAFKKNKKEVIFVEGFDGNLKDSYLSDETTDALIKMTKTSKGFVNYIIQTNWINLLLITLNLKKNKLQPEPEEDVEKRMKRLKRAFNFLLIMLILTSTAYYIFRQCPFGSELVTIKLQKDTTVNKNFNLISNQIPHTEKYCRLSGNKEVIDVIHGKHLLLNNNEKKIIETYFKLGKHHGKSIEYFEKGQVALEKNFFENLLRGEFIKWYEGAAGTKPQVEEYCKYNDIGEGICTGWYENKKKKHTGKKISQTDNFGSPITQNDGEWKYWNMDGTLQKIVYYRNGMKIKTDYFGFKIASKLRLKENITLALFVNNGKNILLANNNNFMIYDYKNNTYLTKQNYDNLKLIDLSKDKKTVFLVAANEKRLFKINNKQEILIERSDQTIKNSKFINNDNYFLTSYLLKDDQVKEIINIYNLNLGKQIFKTKIPINLKTRILSPNENYILSIENSNKFHINNINRQTSLYELTTKAPLDRIEIITDDIIMYITKSSKDGSNLPSAFIYDIYFHNFIKNEPLFKTQFGIKTDFAAISPSSQYLIIKTSNDLKIYDIFNNSVYAELSFNEKINDVLFSPFGNFVIINKQKGIEIYNMKQRKLTRSFTLNQPINKIYLSKNENYLLFSYPIFEKNVPSVETSIVNLKSGSLLKKIIQKQDFILSFAGNDRYLVGSLKHTALPQLHEDIITNIHFIYDLIDNKYIASQEDSNITRSSYIEGRTINFIDLESIEDPKTGQSEKIVTVYENI